MKIKETQTMARQVRLGIVGLGAQGSMYGRLIHPRLRNKRIREEGQFPERK